MVEYRIKIMKIHLNNKQTKYRLNSSKIKKIINLLCLNLDFNKRKWSDISVIIVNEDEIKSLHKKYFNKNTTTDVITFTYPPIPCEKYYSGDIIINIDIAHEEGIKRKNINYELAFYIAHGIDHLNGNNDDTLEKRKKMHNREKKWVAKLDEIDLLNNLIS